MIGYTEFGHDIRRELRNRGKSINWLAKQIGCSNAQLSEMLKGTRGLVTRYNNWENKIKEILEHD